MEQTYLVNALVLDKNPWRENDTRVFLYTREIGRLDLVVRGAKKLGSKLAGRLEPFCQAEIMVIAGRQLSYAGGVATGQSYSRLNSDYDKLMAAGRVVALVLRLTREGVSDQALYQLLVEYFTLSDQAVKRVVQARFLALAAQLKILAALGLIGDSHFCASCAVSLRGNGWFLPSGEIVCRSCRPALSQSNGLAGEQSSIELGSTAINLLQKLSDGSLEQAVRGCHLDKQGLLKLEQVAATISQNQQ
ncbi:MAG: DNA repair protein RecO [Candidatus Falkowbacteria bacterium]